MMYANNFGAGESVPWAFPEVLAYLDARYGVTAASERVSAWASTLKGSISADQATGANQPIQLPFTGDKYLACFGVDANAVTTSNAVERTITGDLSAVVGVALDSVAPSVYYSLIGQWPSALQRNWFLFVDTGATGKLNFSYSVDGTTIVQLACTATLASVGIAAFQKIYLGVFHDVDNGAGGNDVKFYWSTDKVTWNQLGATVTTAGTVTRHASTGIIEAGLETGVLPLSGKLYEAEVYSGNYFAGSGTLVADFNASDWSETSNNGATQVSSTTGETWTLVNTGSKPAQIVGSAQILFDGSAHTMEAAFTLAQPCTMVGVIKQVTWTNNDYMWDGATVNTAAVYQNATTPRLRQYGGADGTQNADLAVGAWGVVSSVFDGASSRLQVNLNSPVTSNPIGATPNGIQIGSAGNGGSYGNVSFKSFAVCNSALPQTRLNQLVAAMARQHGISV